MMLIRHAKRNGAGFEIDAADADRRGAEVDGDDGKPLHESLS
jgi:hypothetical protein